MKFFHVSDAYVILALKYVLFIAIFLFACIFLNHIKCLIIISSTAIFSFNSIHSSLFLSCSNSSTLPLVYLKGNFNVKQPMLMLKRNESNAHISDINCHLDNRFKSFVGMCHLSILLSMYVCKSPLIYARIENASNREEATGNVVARVVLNVS